MNTLDDSEPAFFAAKEFYAEMKVVAWLIFFSALIVSLFIFAFVNNGGENPFKNLLP